MFKKILIILFVLTGILSTQSQNRALDSLKLKLKQSTSDTSTYWLKNLIAEQYFNFRPDTAFVLWKKVEKDVTPLIKNSQGKEKRVFQRTLAEVKNSIGAYYYSSGSIDSVVRYWQESLSIRYEMKDEYGIALSLLNFGFYYYSTQDLAKAVDYWQKAEVMAEKINNISIQTSALADLGGVYADIGENVKGRDTYLKLIDLRIKNNEIDELESPYFNLASIYRNLHDINNSWLYARKSYILATHKNRIESIALVEGLFGELHEISGNKDSALIFFNASYQKAKAYSYIHILTNASNNLATFYYAQKDYNMSLKYALECFQNATATKVPSDISRSTELLSSIYEKKGDINNAFYYFKKYIHLKDSIDRITNGKSILKKQLEFDHEREKINLKKEQEKKDLITREEKKNQRIIIYAISIVLILSFLLIIFVYKGFRQKQKANRELEQKNILIAQQKELVDEKQKEILDSINYAKRIQYTLLANDVLLKQNLKEHFILFKPKDIVSGDFYWAAEHDDKFYLAVCDSTGHGVPGAFMSLLNIGFLNEAVKEKEISQPHEILNYVRKRLIESVGKEEQQDGMDAVIICIDKNKQTITYSAANNGPIIITKNKITELPKDKMPVGKGERTDSFTLHAINMTSSDVLYLYTDGYADQFGGPGGKKFKYKPLNEMLFTNTLLPLDVQVHILTKNFEDWKGDLEQVDDVCIIGIKL